MGRIKWYVAGLFSGGALMFGALKYHILYTKDGLIAVPKRTATLSETFLDVRKFGPSDWVEHPDLMAAVVKHDQTELLEKSTMDSLRGEADRWIDDLRGGRPD